MFAVRPVSDLRNKFKAISKIVHKHGEPVFITKNGQSDMVVMSYEHFRNLELRLQLYEKLAVAEAQDVEGAPTHDLDDVIREVKTRLGL